MSRMYEKIKTYFDSGLWNKTRVRNMVLRNHITEAEYKIIVGEEFVV